MARARKDLLTRLTDAGEDAISRLHDAPGADRLLGVANSMRDRVDELQKKVRGIDELERRIAALEQRVEERLGPEAQAGACEADDREGDPAGAEAQAAGRRRHAGVDRPAGGASPG